VFAVMLLLPQTREGLALRRWLVEAPARALNRLRGGHVKLALMIALAGAAAIALGREAMLVFASGAPELIGWIAAFDIATYADIVAAALIVAAAVRLKSAAAYVRLLSGRWRARRTSRRAVRAPLKRKAPPADSEGEPWPAALAAA
jgi:hypothetical protein